MKIYYNPKLMPDEDLARLLICKVPDGKDFTSPEELIPYLNGRWVELIKKSEMSFEKLEKEVYFWLQLENPFLDPARPQDLATLILESPHYSKVLSDPEEISEEKYDTLDMVTAISIYEGETFVSLLQLLNGYF